MPSDQVGGMPQANLRGRVVYRRRFFVWVVAVTFPSLFNPGGDRSYLPSLVGGSKALFLFVMRSTTLLIENGYADAQSEMSKASGQAAPSP